MKTITLKISELYDDVLTISFVGSNGMTTNVTIGAYAIKNGDRIIVGDNGEISQISLD